MGGWSMTWSMNCRIGKVRALPAALLLASGIASPATAQFYVGRIDVTITDQTGGRVPGVTVEVAGPLNQSIVSDALGEAHFLNLSVGIYTVKASLTGFKTYENSNITVVSGGAVSLDVRLAVAGEQATVNVVAAPPTVDIKKETTTTNVTLEELQNIPSARDPWVVMQTVPSVVVDRVNVGGSESGQQSKFNAKGADGSQNTWNLDGIPITDVATTAPGASPTFYDFDSFQEINITTGGADVLNGTSGVGINFVLKAGTNTPHGSTRYYGEREGLQGNNMSPALAKVIGGSSPDCAASNYTKHCGNRTDHYDDYGAELGGPIMKDRLWIWGSAAKTDIGIRALTGTLDHTTLKDYALKGTGQLDKMLRGSITYWRGENLTFGRGAAANRPAETTLDQSGPTQMFKGEADLTIRNSAVVSVRYAHISHNYALTPEGGNQSVYFDDGGIAHNSWYYYTANRPQQVAGADGSYFHGRHEVKFGYSWKKANVTSTTSWPGTNIVTHWNGYPNMVAEVIRDYTANTVGKYNSAYGSDTLSFKRATVNLGLRWDHSVSLALAASVPAVPGFENLLPALTAPAVPDGITYNNVTPRIGVNYSLDSARKTQVRGSYAMFASQLGASDGLVVAPAQYSYVYYNAVDRTSSGAPCTTVGVSGCDGTAELNEILFSQGLQGYGGFDPSNPTNIKKSVNVIGSHLSSPITHEVIVGLDHEVMAGFVVSGTFTYRRFTNLRWSPRIGVREAQYQQTGVLSGTFPEVGTVSVPFYAINASAIPPGGGREYINRDGYHQRFLGFEVSATKRLSNRWQARAGFSTNDQREFFDNPATSIEDPTPTCRAGACSPLVNGGEVLYPSGGSGKSNIFVALPTYQFVANGMYQGPWGFNFAANLIARQGYAEPFYMSNVVTGDPLSNRKSILLSRDVNSDRLPAVTSLDGRIEKTLTVRSRAKVALDFDVFNLLNNATILGRTYDVRLTGPLGFLQTTEIMQPRIARLGFRVSF